MTESLVLLPAFFPLAKAAVNKPVMTVAAKAIIVGPILPAVLPLVPLVLLLNLYLLVLVVLEPLPVMSR